MTKEPTITTGAKAIILRSGQLLAIQLADADGDWYTLPGGGQESCETLRDTVRRESLEEVGIEVTVGDLAFVREYIGLNHEFAQKEGHVHRVEFMFYCQISDDAVPGSGLLPDDLQVGVEWLPVAELDRYPLYPLTLRALIMRYKDGDPTLYLGDVN